MSKELEQKIRSYIAKNPDWSTGLQLLRKLIKATELEETIKWGAPVYQKDKKNIVGLSSFSKHFGLWFFQGCFLKDAQKVLVNAQEGKTKAMRQMRFTSIEDIQPQLISTYVNEAIKNHEKGLVLKKEKTPVSYDLAMELKTAFLTNVELKNSFYKLSPYKQKEYSNYISEAKREETKAKRFKKVLPLIKEAKSIY